MLARINPNLGADAFSPAEEPVPEGLRQTLGYEG